MCPWSPTYSSILTFVIIQNIYGGSNMNLEPRIKTAPTKLQLPRGETAVFNCMVENLGDRHIVWRRGYDVLATERMVLSLDPRITVAADRDLFSLSIQDINNQDKGDYVCQISTISGSTNLISVEHSLDILVPAQVESSLESAYLTLQEGEDALLECRVSGNPAPAVSWKMQGSERPLHGTRCAGGSCLNIISVQRKDGGVYMCTAYNGVGAPHTATVHLNVQYKPKIATPEDQQIRIEQGEISLECTVEGEPRPTVSWYLHTNKLNTSANIKITESGTKHVLVLKDTSQALFGNYSCVAKNILGESRKYIEVHGRPSPAVFSSQESKPIREDYVLSWEVSSPTTVLEYRLLYRKIIKGDIRSKYEGDDWTNVIIPGYDYQDNSNAKKMSWKLEKLLPDTDYECLIQARNIHGWSQPSRMFSFNTSIKSAPSSGSQGLSWNRSGSLPSLYSTGSMIDGSLPALYRIHGFWILTCTSGAFRYFL